MSASDLRADLMSALETAPKPVTRESVLRIASEKLPPAEVTQFTKWLDTHESYLLSRLNYA